VSQGVGDEGACCQLCGATANCTAWTLVKPAAPGDLGSCHIKTTLVGQHPDPQDVSCSTGILKRARTHYSNPFKPSSACLSDELPLYVRGINGRWVNGSKCSQCCE
jgi:hypothetical protein